jgi:hypothetical protein
MRFEKIQPEHLQSERTSLITLIRTTVPTHGDLKSEPGLRSKNDDPKLHCHKVLVDQEYEKRRKNNIEKGQKRAWNTFCGTVHFVPVNLIGSLLLKKNT